MGSSLGTPVLGKACEAFGSYPCAFAICSVKKGKYPDPVLRSRTEFRALLEEAKKNPQDGGQDGLADFYSRTFRTPAAVCATFKSSSHSKSNKHHSKSGNGKTEPLGLKMDLLYLVWEGIRSQSGQVQKAAIRAVVACLLDEEDQANT